MSENTILRNKKIKKEYNEIRADLITSRDEAEKILAEKYGRSTKTIRDIIFRKNYCKPTQKN